MKSMNEVKNRFSECIHCEKFYECKYKKEKPEYCLHFRARKDEENG